MAAETRRFPSPSTRPAAAAVIDADYMVVDAPRPDERRPGASALVRAERAGGLEALLPARRERVPPFGRRGGPGFWSFGLALVLLSFWVSGGHALLLGQASPTAATSSGGLTLAMLDSGVRPMGGRSVLSVEAEILNGAATARLPPAVAVLVVTGDDVTMRYVLAAAGEAIAPGARRRYASRLAVPPGGVRSVSLAFAS